MGEIRLERDGKGSPEVVLELASLRECHLCKELKEQRM